MVQHPVPERVEPSGRDRDVVQQQRVEDDPHHRPQREHRTRRDTVQRQPDWHLPGCHGNREPDDQARQGCLPGRSPQHAQHDQNHDDRQHRDQKRKRQAVANRREQLMKHFPPKTLSRPAPGRPPQYGACFWNARLSRRRLFRCHSRCDRAARSGTVHHADFPAVPVPGQRL